MVIQISELARIPQKALVTDTRGLKVHFVVLCQMTDQTTSCHSGIDTVSQIVPDFQSTILLPGMLWCEAFIQWIVYLSNRAVYPPGWTDCKLYYFLFHFFAHYSSVLLIIMSVEKFIVMYFPLKAKLVCTLRTARWACLIGAIILIAFDAQFFITVEFQVNGSLKRCRYSNEEYAFVFEKIKSIIYSYGPFIFMVISSVAIASRFIYLKRNMGNGLESTNIAVNKSAIRGTSTLLLLSITFIILTGPVSIYPAVAKAPNQIVITVFVLVQYLNHGINAVLYCLVGSRFRTELLKTIKCFGNKANSKNVNRTTSVFIVNLNTDS